MSTGSQLLPHVGRHLAFPVFPSQVGYVGCDSDIFLAFTLRTAPSGPQPFDLPLWPAVESLAQVCN